MTESNSAQPVPQPDTTLHAGLEALLMVAEGPLAPATFAAALGVDRAQAELALTTLAADYDRQQRGFELRAVAGGWRFYTRPEYAEVVEQFVRDGQQTRLTQAALETLAVVAYHQPVTRARISAIRGVNVDGVMRTLVARGLAQESGTDPESGAHLYRTTSYFLERIGVDSLAELPELAPYLPEMGEMEEELVALISQPTASHTAAGNSPEQPEESDVATTTDPQNEAPHE